MTHRQFTSALAALALAGAGLAVGSGAVSAHATDSRRTLGTRSLATVLASDGHHFDHNWHDFDIADKIVTKLLSSKGRTVRWRSSVTGTSRSPPSCPPTERSVAAPLTSSAGTSGPSAGSTGRSGTLPAVRRPPRTSSSRTWSPAKR
jgi:hypothetical protein